jgi:hypothetical protein
MMRGFALGLLGAVLACVLVSYAELVVKSVQISVLQLPPVAVVLLLLTVAASAAFKRARSGWGLSQQELLVAYCMTVISAMVSSRGLLEKLIPVLVSPAYFANSGNRWAELYFPHIKRWMVPFNPNASQPELLAKRFYEGLRPGETIPWHQWIGPLTMWGMLALLIFGTFLCLAAILRKHWVENERLAFPLVQLPLEIAGAGKGEGILRNKLTWIGFSVAAGFYMINGLHGIYPNVPEFPLAIWFGSFITNPPFNVLGSNMIVFCFAGIGLLYLLPLDVLFSIWFFFVLTMLQTVVAAAYNMDMPVLKMYYVPYFIGYQAIGAYLVLAGFLFYTARRHLAVVFKSALRIGKADDSNELLPYRAAVFGLVLCFLGSVAWLRMAGMSAWLAIFELGAYVFLIALVMARGTVESGLMMTETSFRAVDIYRIFAPTSAMGAANMTVLAFMDAVFFRDLRGLLLSAFLDGTVIADQTKIRRRKFVVLFAVAIIAAVVVGCAFQLWLSYTKGGVTLYSYTYLDNNLRGFRAYQEPMLGIEPNVGWQGPLFLAVGIVVTALLCWARYLFYWWPLNPLGYALAASWTVKVLWFPCLIAWLAKCGLLKYGGMRMFVAARPFFIGLVIGEFSISIFWAVAAWLFGCPGPEFAW